MVLVTHGPIYWCVQITTDPTSAPEQYCRYDHSLEGAISSLGPEMVIEFHSCDVPYLWGSFIIQITSDRDECTENVDNCGVTSECVNLPGSFQCDCPRGYHTTDLINCQEWGGSLTAVSAVQTLHSHPTFPDMYEIYKDHYWTIVADHYNSKVTLIFTHFHLEEETDCSCDWLQVDPSGSGYLLGHRYCGSVLPPTTSSQSNMLTLHFHSDNMITGTGFELMYTSTYCGGVMVAGPEPAHLHSPGYLSGPYPNNVTCVWMIRSQDFQPLTLYFTDFSLEEETWRWNGQATSWADMWRADCYHDSVAVVSSSRFNAPQFFCGVPDINNMVFSGYTVFVMLTTDMAGQRAGFNATFSTSYGGGELPVDGATHTLLSPNYPLPYNDDSTTTWTLTSPLGPVYLTLHHLHLEYHTTCQYDSLTISHGGGGGGGGRRFRQVVDNPALQELALLPPGVAQADQAGLTLCGEVSPATKQLLKDFTFHTPQVVVVLRTDMSEVFPGFHITYTADTDECEMNPCKLGETCVNTLGSYICRKE